MNYDRGTLHHQGVGDREISSAIFSQLSLSLPWVGDRKNFLFFEEF